MKTPPKTLLGSLLASFLTLLGCGPAGQPAGNSLGNRSLVEEIRIEGFDPEGEPVLKKWSDGSLWIHFEAMPPFFAEDAGTEAEFEEFEAKLAEALGVLVRRDERELFVIPQPRPDTAAKAKAWLEGYRRGRP